uniref:uncharacterized protein LOC100389376 isoform X2 n=1 Tax=Callithrix jacchus TaxID=9483 RepID=UPI0023DD13CE|nr:uncharacterized protein LOC100389376 isoform X2 [Callithrix jacchus]
MGPVTSLPPPGAEWKAAGGREGASASEEKFCVRRDFSLALCSAAYNEPADWPQLGPRCLVRSKGCSWECVKAIGFKGSIWKGECEVRGVLLEPWEEGVGQPLLLPLVVPVLEVPGGIGVHAPKACYSLLLRRCPAPSNIFWPSRGQPELTKAVPLDD